MGCSHDHSLKPAACSGTSSFMAPGEKEKEKGEGNAMEKILGETPVYVKELIAGGTAGGFAKTAVAPLERVKILFQTRRGEFQSLGVRRSLGWILRTEGVRGLYRGNGASVARIVPYAALHFMTYEQYRRWIIEYYPGIGTGPIIDLLAGSFAGGTAVMCTYPLDLARTMLAYQVRGSHTMDMDNKVRRAHFQPAYRGIIDVFKIVYRESGLRGLYRGVAPSLYGIFPYAGLKFYVYEDLKRHIPKKHENSVFVKLACGSVAGLVGQTITYPLDVVRRQMQVQTLLVTKDGPSSLQLMDREFKGTLDGLMTIVQRQGWRQLFSGLSINYLKVVPSVAIGFTAYDAVKSFLGIPSRASAHSRSKE